MPIKRKAEILKIANHIISIPLANIFNSMAVFRSPVIGDLGKNNVWVNVYP